MIRIGLMGDIGSGKSFVAKLFSCPVFDADREVNILYKKSRICFSKLKKKLPNFIRSFPIKKSELLKAIKHDNKNLIKISSVVHPLVRQNMKIFLKKNIKKKMVILDIPLLIENNLNEKDDILIFVSAKKSKVLRRLKKRPNFSLKVLKNLKKKQLFLSKKRKFAKYIIDNNFPPNIMKSKINLLKKKILYERSST